MKRIVHLIQLVTLHLTPAMQRQPNSDSAHREWPYGKKTSTPLSVHKEIIKIEPPQWTESEYDSPLWMIHRKTSK